MTTNQTQDTSSDGDASMTAITIKDASQGQHEPAKFALSPLVRSLVVLGILLALFLFSLDNTVVADVQPAIIETLGEIEKLPWISVAYALGGIATNLFWAKLFGEFDNKILFIISFVLFEVGSALCGGAPTLNALIVGRAICGIGGIGVYLGALNIIALITSELERPIFVGVIGLTWGFGTVLGPIIGGALTDSSATWRWAFYLNLCVGAAVAPIILFLVPSLEVRQGSSILERTRRLDFTGALLIAGAIITLIMAIAFGGAVYAWNSGSTIALLVVSFVLWTCFILQQYFCILTTTETRLFPAEFVKDVQMDILFVAMAAGQVIQYLVIYFVPLYFQFVRGDSALQAGVRILPFIVLVVFAVMVNGALLPLGYYMPWFLAGGVITLIGTSLLHTVSATTSNGVFYGFQVIVAVGVGLFAQSGFAIAQVKMKGDQVAPAVAFIGVAQIGGIALGLTISNSIFLNQATNKISNIFPALPREVVQAAISGVRSDTVLGGNVDDGTRAKVLDAIVESITEVFIMTIVAAAAVVVASVFMKRERLFPKPLSSGGMGGEEASETVEK